MKVLKGFGLAVLGLLLFVSLSIFGLAFILNSTLLNPNFVANEVDKIDISAVTSEVIVEEIGEQPPAEILFLKAALNSIISSQEPLIKEQLHNAIFSGYDYLLKKSDKLEIVISLGWLKAGLRDNLWQAFKQNLPTELSGLPQDQVQAYFDQYYQEIAAQIPSDFTVDESVIPTDTMQNIALARQIIGYFKIGFFSLIGFMVLLVLLIILIHRNVRGSTRTLGIVLLVYGVLEYANVFISRSYVPSLIQSIFQSSNIPSSLQVWLGGLFVDMLAPLQIFSIGVLIGGAVLLAASFVYKPATAGD